MLDQEVEDEVVMDQYAYETDEDKDEARKDKVIRLGDEQSEQRVKQESRLSQQPETKVD